MPVLTPDERRGAATVALLLCLGAGYDLWRLWTAPPPRVQVAPQAARGVAGPAPEAHVPAAVPPPPESGAPVVAAPSLRVDLNRAGARELDALPGIGPVLAARIVAHRERHGPFRRPEELLAVRGIGPRLYERLKGRVAVGPTGAGPARPRPPIR